MAGETGSPTSSLMQRLEDEPYRFSFFQAARRLECLNRDGPRIGQSKRATEDPVRFSQIPSLSFAPSTVAQYQPAREDRAARLFVNFMGLLGPNGPMPLHLTQHARSRERNFDDPTFARFLDIFHHRMISLFYRAWACNNPTVSFDRNTQDEDRFAIYIGSLFGLGLDGVRHCDAVTDVAKLHYSGRLVCQTRPVEGLAALLQDFFKTPVRINEFVGQWLRLPADAVCKLGESRETGLMGHTLIVGSRMWDCQQKFRINMGPMSLAEYQRLLPGGKSLERLVAWVRNYTADELSWEVRLILRADEVPNTKLGGFGQLGWSTWLNSRGFDRDADDLILAPAALMN